MPTFDRRLAGDRIMRYEDDQRRATELRRKVPLTGDEAAFLNHVGTTDYATALAESLSGALDQIAVLHRDAEDRDVELDRLRRNTAVLGRLQRDGDVAESVSEKLIEDYPIGDDEVEGRIGFAQGIAAYARFLRTGLAEDGLARLLDI